MTSADLMNLALDDFRNSKFDKASDGDRFFEKYGVGNNVIHLEGPFERFNHYKDLLAALRAADEQKFGVIHKGTPLYFLSWLAFDAARPARRSLARSATKHECKIRNGTGAGAA